MEQSITHSDYQILLTKIDRLLRKGENNITDEKADQLRAMALTAQKYETQTYLSARRKIKAQIYNGLRNEAADLYPTEKAIRSVVVSVGMSAGEIDMQGTAKHIWDSVLSIAVFRQKLGDIVSYIASEFPSNAIFANTLAAIKNESAFDRVENPLDAKPNDELTQSEMICDSNLFRQNFYDHFNNHRNIVNDLKGQISDVMRRDSDLLAKSCNQNYSDATNFFELLYRILHLEYKCQSNSRDFSRVNYFFSKWTWRIGNYLASYIYLIKFIHEKCYSENDRSKYIAILLTSSTNDELRLMFYYVVSRNSAEKDELINLCREFNFFDALKNPSLPLIYQEDWEEFNR